MHEYGLVQSILDSAEQNARQHGATAVKRLTVAVGDLAGVDRALLALAWETFRERTLCEGAELILRPVPAAWGCPKCSAEIPTGGFLRCPDCAVPARLIAGDCLLLERLELEVPDV